MRVIGITGGVGSGKSRVLTYMKERYQAVICQADHVAWKLQEPGQTCYNEILKQFGNHILHEDGTINRGKLGQIVFADEEKRLLLNHIIHPAVKEYIIESISMESAKGTGCFVIEAALLLEDHYDQICDELWYIHTDEELRRRRLINDRKYSNEKIDAIMSSQLPEREFRKHCQIVIDNSGDFGDTCYQIDKLMNRRKL